ncbi:MULTISPECIES: YveK family protein [Limosilactobacillus]|uniref:YveK family protein n=1 Tax=Limosilactobacillus TaxID=2742598 RepID=UPI00242A903F|nr:MULTISPECIES: Wzz/FepE/Etk N-terminal domain-containing protein [Limosilactobacillus]MCI6852763.1 Wzz/FepE/Etk N-terminal domain-containing protein [Limosilactobacillus vaginalis]MDY4865962.1 Wzz/FepE/Etk N-terminal domain-containing protein [Limosilactobacillus sp.]
MSNKQKTKDIYKIIIKNCLLIIIFTLGFGVFGYFYAQHKQSTVYKTTQNVIINHSYTGESANDEVQADLSLTKTYQEIIKSDDVVRKAKEYLPNELRKKYSVNDIAKMTSAQVIPSTTMIEISASSPSANTSAQLTNAIVRAAEKEVPSKIPSGSIKSVSKSDKDDAKSITSPSRKKYTVLGLAVGFLLGMVVSFSITTWTKLI